MNTDLIRNFLASFKLGVAQAIQKIAKVTLMRISEIEVRNCEGF